MIYNDLPIEIQSKIDKYIQQNIQNYVQNHLLFELLDFHTKKIKKNIYNYYSDYGLKYNFIDYSIIENDIMFWMNNPFSQNMDHPFMTGRLTKLFINIIKRIFNNEKVNNILLRVNSENFDNEYYNHFSCSFSLIDKNYSKKKMVKIILDNLNINEIEDFYIYQMNQIGKHINKNILDINILI